MNALDLRPDTARSALSGLVRRRGSDDDVVERYARALWSTLTEPGDGIAAHVIAHEGAAHGIRLLEGWCAGVQAAVPGVSDADFVAGCKRWAPRLAAAPISVMAPAARAAGVQMIVPADPSWPHSLDDLGMHAPLCLWVRGDVDALNRLQPSVALVGARAATGYGELVAADLASDLAGSGVPIVSGAAYGIDGAAHRAALAVGGLTVALLAGGVDRAYPAGHADLLRRIADNGAVVSEVPCGAAPTKWRFLQRNRLIAALSDATVVVEAGWRSGSLNTAGHAAALSRPLGAVPGPITSAASAGCHRLLREYDARCVTSAADVRELIERGGLDTRQPAGPFPTHGESATDDRSRVRDALSTRTWRGTDDIAQRSGMSRDDVEMILGFLRLDGEVRSSADGWRRAT
ncbi:DNA-processing protein DprA [Microbacterium sp. P02]|uniref:DNA-processing protein DprA n=1 Tax=Microbacterium sp. P02 TaxID=3366260 RepID=UPI003671C7E0